MMIHPADAKLLADRRHRELVAEADAFRATRRAGPPGQDCRVPTAEPHPPGGRAGRRPCRPDPRWAGIGRSIPHRLRFALRVPHRSRQLR